MKSGAPLLSRLRSSLSLSSTRIGEGLSRLFVQRKLDATTIEELEELLISADFGVQTAADITSNIASSRYDSTVGPDEARSVLVEEIIKVLEPVACPLVVDPSSKPYVVLVVGVNGTGKTTTIGKLANLYKRQGCKVMVAAGDTFRAAAIEQLTLWGERAGAVVVSSNEKADAAALVFDAHQRALRETFDLLIIDTAGRLHNKSDLMAQLEKMVRVVSKNDVNAPHSILLVLDATTGQNAVKQVEVFSKACGITGLVMTKLDGTARGGVLVSIANRYGLPVHAIGIGEEIDDLILLDAGDFARALVGIKA